MRCGAHIMDITSKTTQKWASPLEESVVDGHHVNGDVRIIPVFSGPLRPINDGCFLLGSEALEKELLLQVQNNNVEFC